MSFIIYFKELSGTEFQKLNMLCEKWSTLSQCGVPAREKGNILSAIGQGKLLMEKNFKKFLGLLSNAEKNDSEKKVTEDDLYGFWSLVDMELQGIYSKFQELEQLKNNNWIAVKKSPIKRTIKKKHAGISLEKKAR